MSQRTFDHLLALCAYLAIIAVGLRICGLIHWSWAVVLAPIWVPLLILTIAVIIAFVVQYIKYYLKLKDKQK